MLTGEKRCAGDKFHCMFALQLEGKIPEARRLAAGRRDKGKCWDWFGKALPC